MLGAYDGERMVGLLICMVVKRGDDVFLWSHMTGTHPDYQRSGIGLALKRFQRRWALDNGYKSIRWTVDPLAARQCLVQPAPARRGRRAQHAQIYHVNFYGDMDDDINRGMPSDRIEVCWQLGSADAASPDARASRCCCCAPTSAAIRMADRNRLGSAIGYTAAVPR